MVAAMKFRSDASRSLASLRWALFVAVSVMAFTPGRAAAADPAEPPLLSISGETLYVNHCAVCHGKSGRGDGPFAGILRVAPADLTTLAARNGGTFPDAAVTRFVDGQSVPPAHGTRQMPVWGRWLGKPIAPGTSSEEVARGEILAILEYLKTLQR
jgi:mono/diheme cytochrome c family protein